MDDIFGGQLQSSVTCATCRHTSHCFDPFWDLSLPIPGKGTKGGVLSSLTAAGASLASCLDAFTSSDNLDAYRCEVCKKDTAAVKRMQVRGPARRVSGTGVASECEVSEMIIAGYCMHHTDASCIGSTESLANSVC